MIIVKQFIPKSKQNNMENKLKITKLLVLFMLTCIGLSSCKKDKIEEPTTPSLIGMWSHVRSTGTSRHTVTQLFFNEDRSGREIIISIIGSQNNATSNESFKWSTENDKVLKIQILGETETYQYTIKENEGLLQLTGANGDTRDFYKDE